MSVQIKIIRGPKAGQSYTFDADEISIGSGRTNDVIVLDNDVSTHHCRLVRVERDYDIEDLNSRYGTFVNGQRLSKAFTLPERAIIELGGQVTIEYERQADKEDEAGKPHPFYLIEGDPSSQPVLVYMENEKIKDAFLLQRELMYVGRSTDNDIIIQEIDISRKHLKLTWQNGRFYAEDMSSRNGTFINGERLKGAVALHHSDALQLGASVRLHLVFRSDLPEEWDKRTRLDGIAISQKEESTQYTLPIQRAGGTRELPSVVKEGELKDHICLVYARENWEAIVATLFSNLQDAKHQVWVDQHLRPGSDAWLASVEQAHRECWLLIVVMSPPALRSSYVKDQYRYFYNREKPIIVVEYEPVDTMPLQLAKVPRIRYDADEPGKMFQRLLYEIMHLKPRHLTD